MKKVTFSCLTLATLLQLIPSNGNAANIQVNKKKTNRTEMKQDTIPANSTKKESEEGERNVMLNASDANKPREIQIGLPSEDVNVYENGLPAVYSSTVHKLAAHWRSDSSLGEVGLLSPSESAITTGNIAYSVNSFSKLGQKDFQGILNYRTNHFGMQNLTSMFQEPSITNGFTRQAFTRTSTREVSTWNLRTMQTAQRFIMPA